MKLTSTTVYLKNENLLQITSYEQCVKICWSFTISIKNERVI